MVLTLIELNLRLSDLQHYNNLRKIRALFRLPKQVIKTLLTDDNDNASDSQVILRKQFVGTTNSSGAVSFSAGTNETFASFSNIDYSMSILTLLGSGTGQGDLVDMTGNISGTGSNTVTITDATILGASAKVKFIGTVTKTSVKPQELRPLIF